MCWHVRTSDQWPPCSHPPASILIWPGAWICQALLCSLSPSAPGSGYNSAIITGGRVSTKYWWYWQQGRGLWLGGDVLPRMPGLTEWKYCYRGGDKRLAWWAERGQRGWGAIWQSFILGVMTLHFRSFWEINLIRKWSPTVASFEFQMFTMDKHYCRMLGIILQGVTKIISEMFSSSSFHRGLVANIFDSCKSSPLSCFAQSGGFLPSHYPSFLKNRLGVTGNIYWSWWHIVHRKTASSGRVSNAWTGPILLVRHNNVKGKNWWHCWNRNGFGPSPPVAIRAQTGRKLRENWKWHKVWTDPGRVRPPTDHQYQSRASHNRNKLPRSQNLIQTDRAVQGQRRSKAALLARWSFVLQ